MKDRVNQILDDAAKALAAEGVKFFLSAVAEKPKTVFIQSDVVGEDLCHILNCTLPTKQDAVNLGIWVGQILSARSKEKK